MSIVGGLCAGILGLTGLSGAAFYLVFMAIASPALAAKAHFRPAQVTHSAKVRARACAIAAHAGSRSLARLLARGLRAV